MNPFNDIAIPISWPDMTAYGDEKWMMFLKRIGMVKNLHFKVGHAAILLIERSSGTVRYFDFGRYLSPRGYGRARSVHFDPRLAIETQAQITSQGDITNITQILEELCEKEEATHGGGRTFFSICRHISFAKGVAYAEKLVANGPILYGALAKDNNSCSRYVAQILTESMEPEDRRRRKVLYPECLKASPTSNVVNAAQDEEVYCFMDGILTQWKMRRKDSLRFQFDLLKDNFTKKGAQGLAPDQTPGMIDEPLRPASVPKDAQWMGGIGEGAWFQLQPQVHDKNTFAILKFAASGKLEYEVQTVCNQGFRADLPYLFTQNFLYNSYAVLQGDIFYIFSAELVGNKTDNNYQKNIKAVI